MLSLTCAVAHVCRLTQVDFYVPEDEGQSANGVTTHGKHAYPVFGGIDPAVHA